MISRGPFEPKPFSEAPHPLKNHHIAPGLSRSCIPLAHSSGHHGRSNPSCLCRWPALMSLCDSSSIHTGSTTEIQQSVQASGLPHIFINEAKDDAFLFVCHTICLPCLSRWTKIFFGLKSQHSHIARSILFSVFITDQMPELTFSIYIYSCFISCSKGTYL